MKKILTILAFVLVSAQFASAIPAAPWTFKYTQPDGSVIVLQNHGDEFFHWTTDASGNVVEKGEDGFWHPSTINEVQRAIGRRARAERRARWSSHDNPPVTNFGDRKILVVLVNFSDSTFVISNPKQAFTNLLNQEGYSANGGHGSVRDFYMENSGNQYRPTFDVYGPVTLTQSSKYYDDNGARVALYQACQALDSQINFGDYDTDNDGYVDMVLFYYAGHNEAEGAGAESIWPHKSTGYGTFDGVNIGTYFCTSELRGSSGSEMCGIGTTTHEVAHSLGVPDFYDTDYEENGETGTTSYYDVMASGPYLDSGRRPPYFNALERYMLGWADAPEEITASGSYTLQPVQNNKSYKVSSSNAGEYYILECRTRQGWDASIPDYGMAIYHVDQSKNTVSSGITAEYLWENTNEINCYSDHPCFYILTTSGGIPTRSQYTNMMFGSTSARSISPSLWSGSSLGLSLTNISRSSTQVTFTATFNTSRTLSGKITDTDGNGVSGAQVVLSKAAYPFEAVQGTLPTDLVTISASDGSYSFTLAENASYEQVLTVRKEGYVPFSINVPISARAETMDVTLFRVGEGEGALLYKFDESQTLTRGGLGAGQQAAGFRYSAAEISQLKLAGAKLKSITFAYSDCTFTDAYVLVFFGTERVLSRKVNSPQSDVYFTVDISDANLTIPSGKDVYIGYGLTGLVSGEYPFYMYGPVTSSAGGNYRLNNFLSSSSWTTTAFSSNNTTVYYDFLVYADIEFPVPDPSPAQYGAAVISISEGVPSVVAPVDKTLHSTAWYLDGSAVSTPPAVSSLSSGSHTYKAVLTYYDGTSETLWYDVDK